MHSRFQYCSARAKRFARPNVAMMVACISSSSGVPWFSSARHIHWASLTFWARAAWNSARCQWCGARAMPESMASCSSACVFRPCVRRFTVSSSLCRMRMIARMYRGLFTSVLRPRLDVASWCSAWWFCCCDGAVCSDRRSVLSCLQEGAALAIVTWVLLLL